ncbi:MAG TPA: DciA family protein [Stellaceae bacterium]
MNKEQDKADATLPARDSEDERRPDERRPGLRAVGPLASRLAAPVVARHGGGILARLKADWPAVIGGEIAAATWPQALGRDGALKLRVAAATALELQHRAPLLIERINVYLGRPAISRLVFVQGPLPLAPAARRSRARQLGSGETESIERQIAAIGDSDLKAALARLGKSVASSAPRRR